MFSPPTILIALIAFLFLKIWLKWQQSRPMPEISKDPAKCRRIIANRLQYGDQPNILTPHEARAIPNHRRRIAFGIDNAFTRTDGIHASLFVNKAKSSINLSPKDWVDVSEFARATTSHWIDHGLINLDPIREMGGCKQENLDRRQINITSLAQVLSLKVVLWLMFGRKDQHQSSDESILRLAQSINRVWISSKQNPTENDIHRFEDDAELQTSLYNVFGTHERPEDNPLNLILPSFETMWRIVLRAFLELKFVAGKDIPAWRQTLTAFAKQPTKDQFESCSSNSSDTQDTQSSPSAKCIVNELLRLYAPTRRIHRAYQWHQGMGASHEIVSADIEGCHLRSDVWGSDAERFDPNRWSNLTTMQRDAFMPFGCAPFQCPAKSAFGPRMIGVLVGSLLMALGDEDRAGSWSLDCDDMKLLDYIRSGKRLCPHRNAYADLYLVQCAI